MRKTNGQFVTTHGMSNSLEYNSWKSMKDRVLNPNHTMSKYYSERGIKICERWINSFSDFYEDMGSRPSSKHTLDRINTDGNYEISNCRWATKIQQERNKRNNIVIEVNGEKIYLKDYAIIVGIPYNVLGKRYRKGLRGEDLCAPLDVTKQRFKKNEKITYS